MSIIDLTNNYGNAFLHSFMDSGFQLHNGVLVSSRIDKSVYLVGSTISVLKQYLFNYKDVPKIVMMQKAIRTQSLKIMENKSESNSIYGSFFLAMGTLAPFSSLMETINIAIYYLASILSEPKNAIILRVSSKDDDLFSACKNVLGSADNVIIETDSKPDKYYQHHYGMDEIGINGRNFNIAVSNDGSLWLDVGNIIVIQKNKVPFAVEFAMGMSTLIANLFGMPHTMLGNTVSDILSMKDKYDFWLGDCLSVVNCLKQEGIVPNSSKMQGRILKRYQKVLFELCDERGLDANELLLQLREYNNGLLLPI